MSSGAEFCTDGKLIWLFAWVWVWNSSMEVFWRPYLNTKSETKFRNRHNFWWWCPFATISSLIESLPSQLSIGEEIIENGHHHQKLWPFQVGDSGEMETDMPRYCEICGSYSYSYSSMIIGGFLTNVTTQLDLMPSETSTWDCPNFWWWCPFATILEPIESWESGLSIEERIFENGPHHQKLWRNRNRAHNFKVKSWKSLKFLTTFKSCPIFQ